MDELINVSVDSHATMPASAWERCLEPEYRRYLPELHDDDDDRWHAISGRLSQMLWSIPRSSRWSTRRACTRQRGADRLGEIVQIVHQDLDAAGAHV